MGGTMRPGSSSERVLRSALDIAGRLGAATELLAGPDLDFPAFNPAVEHRVPAAQKFLAAIRRADGIIISSPSYHGSISGLIKNALDYTEDMRDDRTGYLDGRAVGCIVCATGAQALGTTLTALRSITHALRGWPTPLGISINTADQAAGHSSKSSTLEAQLELMMGQVMQIALMRRNLMSAEAAPVSFDNSGSADRRQRNEASWNFESPSQAVRKIKANDTLY
jgi:FMN reductase